MNVLDTQQRFILFIFYFIFYFILKEKKRKVRIIGNMCLEFPKSTQLLQHGKNDGRRTRVS